MPEQIPAVPLRALSGHIADLLLVGVGEHEAVRHRTTRIAWHAFFFSTVLFVVWHVCARLILSPSLTSSPELLARIRLVEALCYAWLIILLTVLACYHYSFVILGKRHARFMTVGFFFATAVLLYARLYFSLFHVNQTFFRWTEATHVPDAAMGIHGWPDVVAFGEFVIYSASVMLNGSYSTLSSNSMVVSSIAVCEGAFGYFFIAVLVGTFVEITSERKGQTDDTKQ